MDLSDIKGCRHKVTRPLSLPPQSLQLPALKTQVPSLIFAIPLFALQRVFLRHAQPDKDAAASVTDEDRIPPTSESTKKVARAIINSAKDKDSYWFGGHFGLEITLSQKTICSHRNHTGRP